MRKCLLSILAAIWLIPFIMMILIALNGQNSTSLTKLLNPSYFTWRNFTDAWEGANFASYFVNTLIVTGISVLLILLMTAMAGYIFGRFEFKGKKALFLLVSAAMTIPTIFFTMPVYQILRMLHAESSLIGLILAEIGGTHVIFLLLFMQFFRSIPKSIEEAAVMDGCTPYDLFFRVMFPIARPVIGTVVVTQTIWTWNSFLYPLILALNNPKIRTLSVGLYAFQGENQIEWGAMAAGATITILPMIGLFICFQRYFIAGIEGAVKE